MEEIRGISPFAIKRKICRPLDTVRRKKIIHASGKVRADLVMEEGIRHMETKKITHHLSASEKSRQTEHRSHLSHEKFSHKKHFVS